MAAFSVSSRGQSGEWRSQHQFPSVRCCSRWAVGSYEAGLFLLGPGAPVICAAVSISLILIRANKRSPLWGRGLARYVGRAGRAVHSPAPFLPPCMLLSFPPSFFFFLSSFLLVEFLSWPSATSFSFPAWQRIRNGFSAPHDFSTANNPSFSSRVSHVCQASLSQELCPVSSNQLHPDVEGKETGSRNKPEMHLLGQSTGSIASSQLSTDPHRVRVRVKGRVSVDGELSWGKIFTNASNRHVGASSGPPCTQ